MPTDFPPLIEIPQELLCLRLPSLDVCALLMPGGATLEGVDVLAYAQPALAPLVPMFRVMEVLVAVKNCIEGAVDLANVPPDPTKLLDCIPVLTEKLAQILAMLPQFSIPAMVVTLLDCILGELNRLRSYITGIIAQVQRALDVIQRASELGDANLSLIGVCASDRTAAQLDDRLKALIVLGRILGFIRLFLELVPGAPVDLVPDLSTILDSAIEDVLSPLDAGIEALTILRDAVRPLIPPSVTLP